jgi:hypothetical protein
MVSSRDRTAAERLSGRGTHMSRNTALLATFLFSVVAAGQNLSVSMNQRIIQGPGINLPGEAQSTVIAPGLKSQCLGGRFLVSNDDLRPPSRGLVIGRDLTSPSGPDILATFDNPPGQGPDPWKGGTIAHNVSERTPRYAYITNDHDLVSLNNGDVLYLTGAASRSNVDVPWFEMTFRGAFGPGARSVLLTWRSTDCGQTFHYSGELDPARIADGSCAMPQFLREENQTIIPGPPYDMGGADGQMVRVDPATNRLYLTFSCVGFQGIYGEAKFALNRNRPLNKTLVAISDTAGASWKSLGFIEKAVWRLPVVPVSGGALAFGIWNEVIFGKSSSPGDYTFDHELLPATASWGWPNFPFAMGKKNSYVFANIFANTVAARTPGTGSFFTVYAMSFPGKGYGYRVAFYDMEKKGFDEPNAEDDVVPAVAGANHFLFHLSVVDNGKGPVLLYWNDIDGDANTVTVRGRFILGPGQQTSDFIISTTAGGMPREFSLIKKGPPGDWYGDYQTAGGFRRSNTVPVVDYYYPMWIESGVIRFAQVQYIERSPKPNLTVRTKPFRWHPQEAAVSLSRLPPEKRHDDEAHESRITVPVVRPRQ